MFSVRRSTLQYSRRALQYTSTHSQQQPNRRLCELSTLAGELACSTLALLDRGAFGKNSRWNSELKGRQSILLICGVWSFDFSRETL